QVAEFGMDFIRSRRSRSEAGRRDHARVSDYRSSGTYWNPAVVLRRALLNGCAPPNHCSYIVVERGARKDVGSRIVGWTPCKQRLERSIDQDPELSKGLSVVIAFRRREILRVHRQSSQGNENEQN